MHKETVWISCINSELWRCQQIECVTHHTTVRYQRRAPAPPSLRSADKHLLLMQPPESDTNVNMTLIWRWRNLIKINLANWLSSFKLRAVAPNEDHLGLYRVGKTTVFIASWLWVVSADYEMIWSLFGEAEEWTCEIQLASSPCFS